MPRFCFIVSSFITGATGSFSTELFGLLSSAAKALDASKIDRQIITRYGFILECISSEYSKSSEYQENYRNCDCSKEFSRKLF